MIVRMEVGMRMDMVLGDPANADQGEGDENFELWGDLRFMPWGLPMRRGRNWGLIARLPGSLLTSGKPPLFSFD